MHKSVLGIIIASSLLNEGEKLDKFFGDIGTSLGKKTRSVLDTTKTEIKTGLKNLGNTAVKTTIPYVGAGLKNVGTGVAISGLKIGKKMYDTGTNLQNKYKK